MGVHLIGGGWDEDVAPLVYGPFLAEVRDEGAVGCLLLDEGDGAEQFTRYATVLRRVAPGVRPVPLLVPEGGVFAPGELDGLDGLLVGGGLTPPIRTPSPRYGRPSHGSSPNARCPTRASPPARSSPPAAPWSADGWTGASPSAPTTRRRTWRRSSSATAWDSSRTPSRCTHPPGGRSGGWSRRWPGARRLRASPWTRTPCCPSRPTAGRRWPGRGRCAWCTAGRSPVPSSYEPGARGSGSPSEPRTGTG